MIGLFLPTDASYVLMLQRIMCMFQLTDKQFTWIALNARARLRKWEEIERLFLAKVTNCVLYFVL